MSASAQSSIEGTVIAGKYQLVRLLGQGGMGAVYEGRNNATFKRCAVKLLLSPELGGNTELIKRFFREARASSIIESDHIVTVYDSGYDTELGWPYMVMEMLQGEDLEALLKRVGVLQPVAAAKLVLQAAMGLARAHEAGIVHRDIKPANLFLTGRETGELIVKLLDFGIAKVKMENLQETSNGLTRTGSMLGTPLYMSPEQVKGASGIDAASDVWSLGIVLFELLSGQLPWTNKASLGTLMAAIIHEDLPLLQDRAPWVPPELAEITHRAISRDTNKRFKNAGELRDALAHIVPDGSRLTPDLLLPVPLEHRGVVAPRLTLNDDGMLRATTRSGLTANAATVGAPVRRPHLGLIVGVASALALLAGGAFLGYRAFVGGSAAQAVASAPGSSSHPVSREPGPAAVAAKRFSLSVAPAGVEVEIDGSKAAVTSGQVGVEGVVGSTRNVRLIYGGQQQDFVVAIADSGIVPSRLDLVIHSEPTPAASRPAAARSASAPRRATPAPPAAGSPASAPVKEVKPLARGSELNRNVDEFGK
jgi:eukaryotic-like serine/threonine-protein kinase